MSGFLLGLCVGFVAAVAMGLFALALALYDIGRGL